MSDRSCLFVRWQDAKGCHQEWQPLEDIQDVPLQDYVIESVGFVIRESDTAIHIAPHLHVDGSDGHYVGDMQIPKSAIIDAWEIE